jgi:hypothetical protein
VQTLGIIETIPLIGIADAAYPVYSNPNYLADARLIHPNGGSPVAELSWGR